jgi:hypothetical protein
MDVDQSTIKSDVPMLKNDVVVFQMGMEGVCREIYYSTNMTTVYDKCFSDITRPNE